MKTAELLSGTDGAYLFHYFTKDEFKTLTIYVSEYQSGTLISKSKVADLDYDGIDSPCIIELVFDAEGHGVDFVFRYCNDEMAVVEGVPVSEMLNHSFYEVFENGDKKWLVTYADVALNGNKHILQDYSPEIDKTLTIYCFQPASGYCACVLIPS